MHDVHAYGNMLHDLITMHEKQGLKLQRKISIDIKMITLNFAHV